MRGAQLPSGETRCDTRLNVLPQHLGRRVTTSLGIVAVDEFVDVTPCIAKFSSVWVLIYASPTHTLYEYTSAHTELNRQLCQCCHSYHVDVRTICPNLTVQSLHNHRAAALHTMSETQFTSTHLWILFCIQSTKSRLGNTPSGGHSGHPHLQACVAGLVGHLLGAIVGVREGVHTRLT
jgi:hypothetical protein